MKKLNTLLLALALAGSAFAQTTWNVDVPHSKIGFNVTHMVVAEVEGGFKDFAGKVVSKTADFDGATVEFTAKTASVDTENEKRDDHLKSPDFFDAAKYPEIKFAGSIVKSGTSYVLKGDFTLHGVTKKVEFPLTYGGSVKAFGGEKAGFKFTGKINRQDYGLTWSKTVESGGLVVSNEVELIVKVELNKA